jgi:methionine-rich copper-binding protein CopC
MKRVLFALNLCVCLVAAPCFGHARLTSSTPASNAELKTPPTTLNLTFNETARLALVKLSGAGHEVNVPVDKTNAAKTFSLPLPTLAPGSYTVQWSAMAIDDGHVTKGSFSFTVAG